MPTTYTATDATWESGATFVVTAATIRAILDVADESPELADDIVPLCAECGEEFDGCGDCAEVTCECEGRQAHRARTCGCGDCGLENIACDQCSDWRPWGSAPHRDSH